MSENMNNNNAKSFEDLLAIINEKTEKAVDFAKKKFQTEKAQYNIVKLEKELGRLYYDCKISGADHTAKMTVLVDEITAYKEIIANINAAPAEPEVVEVVPAEE